ncbi:MAG: type II secretion system protein, partial [Candidatus Gastranaerophilaceae bacterium]|nr:type II secretion system protein [Candidatus Gastranaerophilaceae bacterium]
ITLCHPELVSGSSHRKTLEITQNKVIATSTMGQMLKQVQHDKKKKAAFTLAEVLITLGIIGVVAALTLPTLISNYQKNQWVTGLKATVSILQNGIKQMMAHESAENLAHTEYLKSKCNGQHVLNDSQRQKCDEIFSSYFKIINVQHIASGDSCNIKTNAFDEAGNGRDCRKYEGYSIYNLVNGTTIGFSSVGNAGDDMIKFYVDVNGVQRGPNILGRDVQMLVVSRYGNVTGYCPRNQGDTSCDSHSIADYNNKLRDMGPGPGPGPGPGQINLIDIKDAVADCSIGNAFSCAEKIMYDGWEMNY